MYTEFYHLKKCPFHITPDPEFLFLSPSHKQALGSIIYGVEQRKGFIAIVGEVGVGKTTILRSYLESVDKDRIKIIYTFNPNLSFEGVLKLLSRELEIDNPRTDTFEMVDALHHKLIEEYREGRNVVFIIDEAQNMPVETLEHLRMLSNLETSKDKLIQIVLIGQPELERVLNLYELRQLKQRIAIYSTISPLTEAESFEYIKFRLTLAARVKAPVFTRGAAQEIIRAAKGIPRSINIISDNALITGFGAQRKPVTSKIVREVIMDLEPRAKPRLRWVFAVLGAIVLTLAAAALIWSDTLLDDALTVVRLPIQQIEKLVRAEPPPSADTAKPDLASRAKRTADVSPKGQEPVQPMAAPEKPASGSNAQALPPVRLEKEIDTVVSEERPATPPSSDVRVDAIAPGASADTKDETVANKLEARVDAGEDAPRHTIQPVSLEADAAVAFPKPSAKTKPPVLQRATVVRTARKGDSLIRIAAEVYDLSVVEVCKRGLILSVIPLNPHIHNINRIDIGEKILFPPLKVPGKTEDKAD